MGKKKHKKNGKHHHHAEAPFGIPPHVAGIAVAAIERINTPAFRQMIAGALGSAAQAFDQRRTPPDAPKPPEPPVPPVSPSERSDAGASRATLAPEAQEAIERAAEQAGKAIEQVATIAASALERASEAMTRWAAKQAQAAGGPSDASHPSD